LLSASVSLFVWAFAFCGVSAFSGVSGDRVSTIGAIEDVAVGVGVLMQVHVGVAVDVLMQLPHVGVGDVAMQVHAGVAVGVLMHELHVAAGVGVLEHMHAAV